MQFQRSRSVLHVIWCKARVNALSGAAVVVSKVLGNLLHWHASLSHPDGCRMPQNVRRAFLPAAPTPFFTESTCSREAADLQLLEEQARHDRLPGAGVVGQEKPNPRQAHKVVVNGLKLMWQWVNAGNGKGKVWVVLVSKPEVVPPRRQGGNAPDRRRMVRAVVSPRGTLVGRSAGRAGGPDRGCSKRCSVGEQFPKAAMIGFPQLVLDNDVVVGCIFRQHICSERSETGTRFLQLGVRHQLPLRACRCFLLLRARA